MLVTQDWQNPRAQGRKVYQIMGVVADTPTWTFRGTVAANCFIINAGGNKIIKQRKEQDCIKEEKNRLRKRQTTFFRL